MQNFLIAFVILYSCFKTTFTAPTAVTRTAAPTSMCFRGEERYKNLKNFMQSLKVEAQNLKLLNYVDGKVIIYVEFRCL